MLRVSTRTAALMVGLICAAVIGTGGAAIYAFRAAGTVEELVRDSVEDMVLATDLDVALLRQRGYVAAFMLDGQNQRWLDELDALEPAFRAKIDRVLASLDTAGERRQLTEAVEAFRRYDAVRDEVVGLCRRGEVDAARRLYLGELDEAYRSAAAAFEVVLASSRGEIREALALGEARLSRLRYVVAGSTCFTIAMGGWLLWLLYAGVFAPLRRMTEQAAAAAGGPPEDAAAFREGHVRALGRYLGTLMSQVERARSDAEKSRLDARHSERLAALGSAIAHIAHEIKNRLALMGGYASLIHRKAADAEAAGRNSLTIYQEALRLEEMLKEVMEFSRPARVSLKVQALDDLVKGVLQALAGQLPEGVTLTTEFDPAAPLVAMDAGRMEQVLLNLVRNSVDAMPSGGAITITTRRTEAGAAVTVRDEGPGIPEDVRERLFTPFFTTKRRGNGLGLAICRQIVTDHGGTVTLDSTPGRGATFTVVLPPAPARTPPGPA